MKIRYKIVGAAAPDTPASPVDPVAQQQEEMNAIDLPEASTIRDLAQRIGVTADHALVNGEDARPDDTLSNDDEVVLFGPSAGKM
jgi:hypothetical protein